MMDLEDDISELSSHSSSHRSRGTSFQILLNDPSDISHVDLDDDDVSRVLSSQLACLPSTKVGIIDFFK